MQRERQRKKHLERERAGRACAPVLWTAYGALVLLVSCALGSVAGPCPPLVLVLAAPLNSVAGLCGPALCPGLVLVLAAPLNSVAGLWPGLLERSVAEQIAMSMPTKIH